MKQIFFTFLVSKKRLKKSQIRRSLIHLFPLFRYLASCFHEKAYNQILKYISSHLIRLRISLLILKIIFTVIGIIIMNITINILLIIALVWLPVIFIIIHLMLIIAMR